MTRLGGCLGARIGLRTLCIAYQHAVRHKTLHPLGRFSKDPLFRNEYTDDSTTKRPLFLQPWYRRDLSQRRPSFPGLTVFLLWSTRVLNNRFMGVCWCVPCRVVYSTHGWGTSDESAPPLVSGADEGGVGSRHGISSKKDVGKKENPTWAASAPQILGMRARTAYIIWRWTFTSLALCVRSFICMTS